MIQIKFYKRFEISLTDCIKELKELDFSTLDLLTRYVIYVNILFKTKRCLQFYQELYKDSIELHNDKLYTLNTSDLVEASTLGLLAQYIDYSVDELFCIKLFEDEL